MYIHASTNSNWENYYNIQQFKSPIRYHTHENHGQKLILQTVKLSIIWLVDGHLTYLETYLTIADIIYIYNSYSVLLFYEPSDILDNCEASNHLGGTQHFCRCEKLSDECQKSETKQHM